MKMEQMAMQIPDGELPKTPRFVTQRINNIRLPRLHFRMALIDIFRKNPICRWTYRRFRPPEEQRAFTMANCTNDPGGIAPANRKAKPVPVVFLSRSDVHDRKFRRCRCDFHM